MVKSGKCGRVGNGSGRQRESRVYFVLDRDFPTPSLPRSLFPPSPSSRLTASCSRPDCFSYSRNVHSRFFPSRRPPTCSIPTFAINFSPPATYLSGGCSHHIYHGLYIVPIMHMSMDAIVLFQFGLIFNFGYKTAAVAVYYRYVEEIVRLLFLFC